MNKTQLKARCKELGIPTEDLTTNDLLRDAIAKREAELEAEKNTAAETKSEETVKESQEIEKEVAENEPEVSKTETEVAENATKVSESETSSGESENKSPEEDPAKGDDSEEEEEEAAEEQEPARLVYEDKRGRKWVFKPTAPKTLNIDGHTMSQREIFDNEDIISELVYGNSSFLTQIIE